MRPPPQGIAIPPELAKWLADAARSISELQVPTFPHVAFTVAVAKLPPAAKYQNCVVNLSDLNTLGRCDGVHWYRLDTGAVIA